MSSQWKELILYIDGSFQRHSSQFHTSDSLQPSGGTLSKSQRFNYMKTLVDVISHPDLRNSTDFSKLLGTTFERLFVLCSDECDDIRIYSEESLNRLTHNLELTDLPRILRQIHLELRRNGPHRSLRSALRRYAELCEHVNPQFLRLFCQDLAPLLNLLSNRDEELLMEEFLDSFGRMSVHIAKYFTPENIVDLMGTWLKFLTMHSPIKRRVGANALVVLVTNCENSVYYVSLLLKQLLGLVPEGYGKYPTILGVLLCLRHLAPYLSNDITQSQSISFKDYLGEADIPETLRNYLLQALVFVVHSSTFSHNNIVNASLETLSVMLTNPHSQVTNWLIQSNRPTLFRSILQSINIDTNSNICDVSDKSFILPQIPDVAGDHFDSELCIIDCPILSDCNVEIIQESTEFSSDNVSVSSADSSDSISNDQDFRGLINDDSGVNLDSKNGSMVNVKHSEYPSVSDSQIDLNNCDLNIQCILDDDAFLLESASVLEIDLFPLTRIIRRLCTTHLLSGISGSVLYNGISQISIQNSTVNCLSAALQIKPELLLIPLFPLQSETFHHCDSPYISDIFLFLSHPDPFTVEKVLILASSFIKHYIHNFNNCSLSSGSKFSFRYMLSFLLDSFIQLLKTSDGIHAKASCSALKGCIPELLQSCFGTLVLETLSQFLYIRHHSFWLARIEFCNLLAVIDWRYVTILERGCIDSHYNQNGRLQKLVASDVLPWLLMDDDPRVCDSFQNLLISLIKSYQVPKDRSIIFDSCEYFSRLYLSENIPNYTGDFQINLKALIAIITNSLFEFDSNTNLMAALNALAFISRQYSPSIYPNSWGISFNMQDVVCCSKFKLCSYGILPFINSQLFKPDILNDCTAHSHLLFLFVSLIKAGIGVLMDYGHSLGTEFTLFHLNDKILSFYCSQLFEHICRILRMFDIIVSRHKIDYSKKRFKSFGILDENKLFDKRKPFPSEKVKKSNVFQTLRTDSRQSKLENKTKTLIGVFSHIKNYVRLFNVLKRSFLAYQHSINLHKRDRFSRFVKVILDTLYDLISCSSAFDLFSHTEEILSYLSSTLKILPSTTLLVIEQFITLLYGWNRNLSNYTSTQACPTRNPITLHDILYFIPLNLFHKELFQLDKDERTIRFHDTFPKISKVQKHVHKVSILDTPASASFKKTDRNFSQKFNIFSRKTNPIPDKQKSPISTLSQPFIAHSFRHQIKLFEGILTYSLNIYSSSSLLTQINILTLLTKLVMFQLNYSLIDSNSILLNKIFNQVGYIEQGLTFDNPSQISTIFQFLVVISVNKPDILPFSKIVLLCESAISTGITTTSISALKPLVIYLYPEAFPLSECLEDYLRDFCQFCKNIKYAEHGHKDVIFTILIRLIQFPECITILANILKSVQNCDAKWVDLSLLIIGPFLQKIKRNQIQIDNLIVYEIVQDLIFNFHPSSTNRISLFFFSLHATTDLDCIQSLLNWIAIGLLVTKLAFKCYDEQCLFTELHEITLIFPKVDVDLIGVVEALQMGPNLSPQQLIVQVITHLSARSISLLRSLVYISRIPDLESTKHILSNFISQLFTLMLWVLKDNIFKRISVCIKLYIQQLITMYLRNEVCGQNSLLHLQGMKNDFPILYLKLLHLCGTQDSRSIFWNQVIDSIKISIEICQNPFHRYIFYAIIFQLFTFIVTLPIKYPLKLLRDESVAQVLLSFTPELYVIGFASILQSSPQLSIFMHNQLKGYLLLNHSPFLMKEVLSLFEYLRFSFTDEFLLSSDRFLNSKNKALSVSFINGLFRNYNSKQALGNCSDAKSFQDLYHPLLSKRIQSNILNKYYHILNASSTVSTSIFSDFSNISESDVISTRSTFVRDPSSNWYFSKIKEIDTHYNFFTMDYLKPFRCLNLENLISLVISPHVDLYFLYFVIESSKACIIDTIGKANSIEICDEDHSTVVISVTKILQHCSYSLFSKVDSYIYNSNSSNSEFIYIVTKCLVTLFDSGLSLWEFVDLSSINQRNLLTFGFMLLKDISMKPFLLTKIDSLIPALLCPSFILDIPQLGQKSQYFHGLILSAINILFDLIIQLLGIGVVNKFTKLFSTIFSCDEDIGKLNVLLTLLATHLNEEFIPSDLISPIGKFILSLCNLDIYYSNLILPSFLWKETSGFVMNTTSFPQISLDRIHDPETFFLMMKRLSTLGWKTKDQFEEIWSLIIKVLVPSCHGEYLCQEERMELMKTSCIAVEAVTTHLLTYLLHPFPGIRNPCYGLDLNNHGDSSTHFFYSRDGLLLNGQRIGFQSKMQTKSGEKICYLQKMLEPALRQSMQFRKVPFLDDNFNKNIDRALDYVGYLTVQFSFPPFVLHSELERNSESTNDHHNSRHNSVFNGLLEVNLNSCVRLLYDLYNNWVLEEISSVPLMLYHSTIKSLLFLSDLFTDESQFEWLLDFCLNLYRIYPIEDEILKVYINLAIFKAGSIIHKDSIKIAGLLDVLDNGLLSSSSPLNISTIEGLIFLFQEKDCTYLAPSISKVTNFILKELVNSQNMILYLHQQQLLVLISAGTTLIIQHNYLLRDQYFLILFIDQLISYCSLPDNDRNWNVLYAILFAFENLIISFSLQQTERAAILNLTLRLLTDGTCSSILFCALSLLVTNMYLGDLSESLVANYHLESLTQLEIDPMTHNIDLITQTRDKIALLLNIIRISGFLEARFTAQILHHILLDLLPSNQSMNTIIGEFLNENQPNVALIGWLMYKLFQMLYQRGQDKEVNVWALLCLSSFIQRRPIKYAIWNLSCLFISISKDHNISNLLPFVLSRIGKVDSWDEDIFLTAGTSFYHTLEHDEKSQFIGCLNQYSKLHFLFLRLQTILKI